jgi:arginase
MAVIVVPYHQDQRLGDDQLPLAVAGGVRLVDPALPDGDIWRRLAALDGAAADQIATDVRAGGPTTVLSGDCLLAMAGLAGTQRAGVDPAIVWLDGHGDVHTLDTTTSGYLGGLSLRLVMGAHPELLAHPLGVEPVAEARCVLVDARDLDPPEVAFLAAGAVRRVGVRELEATSVPDGPLILHVDVDVTNPDELPGLLIPAPGGPAATEVVAAVRRILATGRVAVLDIACTWHPTTDQRLQQTRTDLLRNLISGHDPAVGHP